MTSIISISGAQGVGKTSIISSLFLDGERVITPSASNVASKYDFETPTAKQEFIVSLMEEQMGTAMVGDGVVFLDRSALDCYSYMELSNDVPEDAKAEFRPRLRKMAENIAFAFIPKPGEFAIQANGIRSVDAEYQKLWHKKLMEFVEECKIPYIELTGSVNERVRAIKQTLHKEGLR